MRKALGMRAVDLAQLLDVTAETVSRWETGKIDVETRAFALLGTLVIERLEGRDDAVQRLRAIEKASTAEPVVLELC
ncbi:MAG: helix-turn-helix domain-containing protein [Kofleriaceae bacterium]|nr:helix-turn-helix domain-containing protein [Kofleriaceae bacterium]